MPQDTVLINHECKDVDDGPAATPIRDVSAARMTRPNESLYKPLVIGRGEKGQRAPPHGLDLASK